MGHTLPTVTQQYHRFISYVKPFRRALRRMDQLVFDQLLDEANQHLPAVGYAANLLPGIGFLLALLLEKQKHIQRLEINLEYFRREFEKSHLELTMEISKLRTELLVARQAKNGS
jgi:hypothetical protein